MKNSIVFLCLLFSQVLFAQEGVQRNSFGAKMKESKVHLGVDLQTKYIWRGMEMMTEDAAPVVFPQINFLSSGFSAYVMGGYSTNGKYSEVDAGVSYSFKWLTVGVNDYYYPSVTGPEDKYFNFKSDETGHWFEAVVTIAPEKLPGYLTVSNFFAGADKDLEGNQAYSTYAEAGCHYDFLNDHQLALALGVAFNERCYNGYDRGFSVCNIEFKYTYNLALKNLSLPLGVSYIINPVFEKAHVNFTTSLYF